MWLCICQMRQWDQILFWGKNCCTECLILKEQGLIVSKFCWIPINAGIRVTFPFQSRSTELILINGANLQPWLRQDSAPCHRLQNDSRERHYGLQPRSFTNNNFFFYRRDGSGGVSYLCLGYLSATWRVIKVFRWSTAFVVVAYTYFTRSAQPALAKSLNISEETCCEAPSWI